MATKFGLKNPWLECNTLLGQRSCRVKERSSCSGMPYDQQTWVQHIAGSNQHNAGLNVMQGPSGVNQRSNEGHKYELHTYILNLRHRHCKRKKFMFIFETMNHATHVPKGSVFTHVCYFGLFNSQTYNGCPDLKRGPQIRTSHLHSKFATQTLQTKEIYVHFRNHEPCHSYA